MSDASRDSHTVRSRWVWGALAGLIVGLVVTGVGIMALSLTWSVLGSVVLVLAGAAAWHGGMFYDTAPTSVDEIVTDVAHGETREAPGPEDRVGGAEAAQRAREADEVRDRAMTGPVGVRRDFIRVGALTVLSAGGWLALSQWFVYPVTATGQDNALRAVGVAVVLIFAGLWLMLHGRSVVATAVAVLASLAMLAVAFLADHDRGASVVSELAAALTGLLGCALTLDPRSRRSR